MFRCKSRDGSQPYVTRRLSMDVVRYSYPLNTTHSRSSSYRSYVSADASTWILSYTQDNRRPNCKLRGLDVKCGSRGLKGAGDALLLNNDDDIFTDLSKATGMDDPAGYYGISAIFSDFNNTGRPEIYVAMILLRNFRTKSGQRKFQEPMRKNLLRM